MHRKERWCALLSHSNFISVFFLLLNQPSGFLSSIHFFLFHFYIHKSVFSFVSRVDKNELEYFYERQKHIFLYAQNDCLRLLFTLPILLSCRLQRFDSNKEHFLSISRSRHFRFRLFLVLCLARQHQVNEKIGKNATNTETEEEECLRKNISWSLSRLFSTLFFVELFGCLSVLVFLCRCMSVSVCIQPCGAVCYFIRFFFFMLFALHCILGWNTKCVYKRCGWCTLSSTIYSCILCIT